MEINEWPVITCDFPFIQLWSFITGYFYGIIRCINGVKSVLLTGKRAITATVPGLISSLAPGTTLAPRWLHQGPVGPAARQADAGEVGPGNCAGNIT